MNKVVAVTCRFVSLWLLASLLASVSLFAGDDPPASPPANPGILPLEQVHPGMRGVAYTVFEGANPEPMEVEVLGVLKNVNGPKGDVILVRLHGAKAEYTGVVAGMSGSPVYLDGKLAGAIAFRIGEFSKEPIAGVTPIEDMLEINALDISQPPAAQPVSTTPAAGASKTASPGEPAALPGSLQDYANYLRPIEAPLVFSGFSEEALRYFGPQFAAAGVVPVMGTGSVTTEKQPEPIVPGSSVSAVLIGGDMSVAATCTVTYIDPQRLLACGHPLMQFGMVDLPMTKAYVVATLASPLDAFKIINTTEPVGAFVQDRHAGILGRFGKVPAMIPVTLTVHGAGSIKQFHYQVLNNAKLTPVAMMVTVFNALQGLNAYGEETSYRMQGNINVGGYPAVRMQNMFAPADSGMPTAVGVATSVGERFNRIFDNPYGTPKIQGVELEFDLIPERRSARLETARTAVTEARPGDDIVIEAVLRPYRGDAFVRQVHVKIPASVARGTLRILVSDGDTLDRMRHFYPALGNRLDLGSTIALLNKEHPDDRLYVSMLQPNPEAMVQDKVMPTLPLSVMNVMEGMRGTQDMVVVGESAVNEASTSLDYVVSGAQIISIIVK
ncbi:MAG TPA: SpoIVB peptidase S55 [Terriglobales bacterium]|jgi:hypothetical protein|nr:SpoIVB peptidase S55 [Terriglobales bacterium]